jgi:hypothetical protein
VVRPRLLVPYLVIAPAPGKPRPVTIWAGIRVVVRNGHTGRGREAMDRQHREDRRPEGDEDVGPYTGLVTVELPPEPRPAPTRAAATRWIRVSNWR